ncbi:MAG: hypothetical protein GY742_17195 [Hyphomicrobiales bacterium]|nr:hypothetical protein [Hyphomicrobiales bacterium]
MIRKLLDIYQYIFPVVLTPMGYWLWWRHYGHDHALAILVFLIPILFAYIVPGVGTNVLKVWEFNTRFRLGRFRPHHGFVFGSVTSLFVLLVIGQPNGDAQVSDMLISGFIVASVLGFWNWLYDIIAIKAGVLKVYNQPFADKKGAEAIATDYAPIFFGGFGFIYGAGIKLAERILTGNVSMWVWSITFVGILLFAIILPVTIYIAWSLHAHGHNGCKPIRKA